MTRGGWIVKIGLVGATAVVGGILAPAVGAAASHVAGRPVSPHAPAAFIAADTYLYHVTVAPGSTQAWVTGVTVPRASAPSKLFVDHRVGGAWSSVPISLPTGSALNGIAAGSTSRIWTVGATPPVSNGATRPSIELSTGTGFHRVALSRIGSGAFNAVAASSAHDAWAVGDSLSGATVTPLAMRWNGTSWRRTAVDGEHAKVELTAISTSGPKNAWAVGQLLDSSARPTTSYLFHWNGTRWSKSYTDPTASLAAVATTGPKLAWATDTAPSGRLGVLSWTGQHWRQQVAPAPSNAIWESITANGSTAYLEGLYDVPTQASQTDFFIDHLVRGFWRSETVQNPYTHNQIHAIAMSSQAAVTVGDGGNLTGERLEHSLIETLTGSTWSTS
jgi:hypothetical protein